CSVEVQFLRNPILAHLDLNPAKIYACAYSRNSFAYSAVPHFSMWSVQLETTYQLFLTCLSSPKQRRGVQRGGSQRPAGCLGQSSATSLP
uniref:Uncharacterized protein n=1 Tax=Gallus gallus TaxID=9031 RepID=A0A8V0YFR4_CHICK